MPGLDWGALEAAHLARSPFDHVAIPQVLTRDCAAAIPGEFPAIRSHGSFSLADARPGPALQTLIDDLRSDRFRAQMSRIFDLDLRDRPASVTLRGQCAGRDGRVHVDSRSKVLSLLIYLNEDWTSPDGRLRLLDREDGHCQGNQVEAVSTSNPLFFRGRFVSKNSTRYHRPNRSNVV